MENQDVQKDLFDRYTALQNHSEYSIEGAVVDMWLESGIVIQPDFITSAGLEELQQEFKTFLSNGQLVIRD